MRIGLGFKQKNPKPLQNPFEPPKYDHSDKQEVLEQKNESHISILERKS